MRFGFRMKIQTTIALAHLHRLYQERYGDSSVPQIQQEIVDDNEKKVMDFRLYIL